MQNVNNNIIDLENEIDFNNISLPAAASGGHDGIVQRLLDAGVDINAKDIDEQTALIYAAENGSDLVFQKLLNSGLNVKDGKGQTALIYALANEYNGIVQQLIDAGADVNVKDDNGQTALSYAIAKDLIAIVKLLVRECNNDVIKAALDSDAVKVTKYFLYSGLALNGTGNLNAAITKLDDLCDYIPNSRRNSGCYSCLSKVKAMLASLNKSFCRTNFLASMVCGIGFTDGWIAICGQMPAAKFKQFIFLMRASALRAAAYNVNDYFVMHMLLLLKANFVSSLPFELRVSVLDFLLVGGVDFIMPELKVIDKLGLPMPASSQVAIDAQMAEEPSNKKSRVESGVAAAYKKST